MSDWLRNILDRINSPSLDWLQVEVTTYCNAGCIYCPRTLLSDQWNSRHMPMGLFNRLIPFINNTELIYLQGWGEPLLNPRLFEMIRICKEKGKKVGFTTNGMLLTEEIAAKIIDLGLDMLGISLAGATQKTHNRIRMSADFDTIIRNLKQFSRLKEAKNSTNPSIHIAYIILRSNFHELKDIIPLANGLGADQVVASHLSLILKPDLYPEAIFFDKEHEDEYSKTLEKIKEEAIKRNIVFEYPRPFLEKDCMVCSENINHASVVNIEGQVLPCVFNNPVLTNGSDLDEFISFGNLQRSNLSRVWYSKEYSRFRNIQTKKKGLVDMPLRCKKCFKRQTS